MATLDEVYRELQQHGIMLALLHAAIMGDGNGSPGMLKDLAEQKREFRTHMEFEAGEHVRLNLWEKLVIRALMIGSGIGATVGGTLLVNLLRGG